MAFRKGRITEIERGSTISQSVEKSSGRVYEPVTKQTTERKKERKNERMSEDKFTPKSANYRTVPMRFNTPIFFLLLALQHSMNFGLLSVHSHVTPIPNPHFCQIVDVGSHRLSPPRPFLYPRVAHVGLLMQKWQRDYFLRKR
jgi:hypothetical protein